LAGTTVNLEIEPGYTEDRDQSAPDTLGDMIKNFENPVYPSKSAVISFGTGDAGVSFKGRIARDLPLARSTRIRPETSSVAPKPFRRRRASWSICRSSWWGVIAYRSRCARCCAELPWSCPFSPSRETRKS